MYLHPPNKKKGKGKNPLHIAIDHQTTNKTQLSQNKNGKIKREETKALEAEKLTLVEVHD